MEKRDFFGIAFRYVLLLIIAFPDLSLVYNVFSPLTIKPLLFILERIYPSTGLIGPGLISVAGTTIEIIPACIGGAAYFLLLTLILTTPMHMGKRVKSLLFALLSFLVINLVRIVFFTHLHISGSPYFGLAHQVTWYFGSTIMVVLIWFVNVWIFNITAIPIYTDLKRIIEDITLEPVDSKITFRKKLKRKANKVLNKIENKEKHNRKELKDELKDLKKKSKKKKRKK